MVKVITERHELSDHSEVFDVVVIKDGARINLHATSAADARELAFQLTETLRDYSTETVSEW